MQTLHELVTHQSNQWKLVTIVTTYLEAISMGQAEFVHDTKEEDNDNTRGES